MALSIPLNVPSRDPRLELQARLRDAPAQHAEALLAGYEVLQGLHDTGALDLLRGTLGSGDKVLDVTVGALSSPESIRAIRNFLLLFKMLGAIDPDALKTFTQAVPQVLNEMVQHLEPPGLWRLLQDFFWNQDFRRGLGAVNTMLEVFGRSCLNGRNTNGLGAEHADPSVSRQRTMSAK